MIRRSIREWEDIRVAEAGGDQSISRAAADSLVATARASRVGGQDGEAILINGHNRLRAQQIVGVLSAPRATLEILPKIDGLDAGATRNCIVHMLARVFNLNVASGAMAELGWQQHDLLEILIRLFCDKLFEVVHRGLSRRYVGHENDLTALRGRLDAKRQFTALVATPQKLACRYEEMSADIPLNQIMKAAVTRLLKIARSTENQRRLTELAFAFADVSVVPVKALPWPAAILDRTNSAWATLLQLAKLLLGERFQTTSSGEALGFSLLFEMNMLFEEYIGRTLQRVLLGTGLKVQLQGPQDYALIGDDLTRRFRTRPDIVISLNGPPLLIIDTKWKRLKGVIDDPKRGVGQADVYQMMAYAHVYQCNRLMLLYPHHDEIGAEEGLLSTHRINGTEDTRLKVAAIKLSDLGSIGKRLRGLVLNEIAQEKLSSGLAA